MQLDLKGKPAKAYIEIKLRNPENRTHEIIIRDLRKNPPEHRSFSVVSRATAEEVKITLKNMLEQMQNKKGE